MKVSSHSLDPSQNSSLMYDAFRFFFPFFCSMTAQNFLLLSSYRGSALWFFPVCFLSSLRVKLCFLTCFFETSLFIIRLQIFNWSGIAVQTRVYSHVAAWQCLKPHQQFFSVGLPSLAFGWLEDVGCPGYRSVQLHTVYKQSWDFSGFQFLLDMSVLFALIKIPILLVPPHNSPLFVLSWSHSCVVLSASRSCIQMSGIAGRRKGTATLLHFHRNVNLFFSARHTLKAITLSFQAWTSNIVICLSNYQSVCVTDRVTPYDYRFEFKQDWQHCLP